MIACARRPPAPPPLTFTRDIAPIGIANCVPGHRQGDVAPFPLLTYADVSKYADGVAEETRKHHMPSWLPERTDLPILGERWLTPDQIATIQRWVGGGKVQGNASDLPKPPSFPDGWQFGRPDLVVSPARPYTLSHPRSAERTGSSFRQAHRDSRGPLFLCSQPHGFLEQ